MIAFLAQNTSSFGHPLSGRPKLFGVSRSQSFESRFEIGPAGGHAFRSADDLSRAIRHGQGTRVKAGRRTEEDRFGDLEREGGTYWRVDRKKKQTKKRFR